MGDIYLHPGQIISIERRCVDNVVVVAKVISPNLPLSRSGHEGLDKRLFHSPNIAAIHYRYPIAHTQ